MRIDLSNARGKIHWTTLSAYIRRSKAMLTGAVVRNLNPRFAHKSLQLLSRCPHLEYLDVSASIGGKELYDLFKGSKKLKTLIASAGLSVSQECLTKFLADLPMIERLEVYDVRTSPNVNLEWPHQLTRLKRLSLRSQQPMYFLDGYWPPLGIPGLFHEFLVPPVLQEPAISILNLEELKLDWSSSPSPLHPVTIRSDLLPRLRRLDLSDCRLGIRQFPPSLEYLRISGGGKASFIPNEDKQLPHLTTLILSNAPGVADDIVLDFLDTFNSPLRVLHVDRCPGVTGGGIIDMSRRDVAKGLVEFNISYAAGVNDRVTENILFNLPNLKVLDVSYTEITGCTIKNLAEGREPPRDSGDSDRSDLVKIERIYARGCEELSSDAVAYGRARGIEIFV